MIIDSIEIFDQNKIANDFNKSFSEIGSVFQKRFLQDEEIESEFKSLKPNKSARFYKISSSVVNITSEKIFFQIKHIFNPSFQQ